jgi:hypothetical protein
MDRIPDIECAATRAIIRASAREDRRKLGSRTGGREGAVREIEALRQVLRDRVEESED